MKRVDPVVTTIQTPTPVLQNEMASHKSYAMDSFHNCSSDDLVSSNGLTKKKLPPDKSFLAAGPYLMQIVIWFLVLSFYNGYYIHIFVTEDLLKVPKDSFYIFAESDHYIFFPVFWPSNTNLVPEDMSTCDKFHSYAMSPSCTHHFHFKHWTNSLDLLYPPSRSQLT